MAALCPWCPGFDASDPANRGASHSLCAACQDRFEHPTFMPRTASVYALFIENPATGYLSIQTYPTSFDRALQIITLSAQPLILSTKDY